MYRIHLTAQDLARTRVADAPMPLFELCLAVRALQDRSQPARLDGWRRRVGMRLSMPARMVRSLIPAVGASPSFLGPASTGAPEDLMVEMRAMPGRQIQADLVAAAEVQPIPAWTRNLPHDVELREQLYDGFKHLYDQLLGPYWPRLADEFTADRSVRMRHFLTGGIERLLAQANPEWMRWNPPVLEIRMANRIEYDLRPAGEGILLVPSVFATRTIVDDEALPQPVVTYPSCHDQPLRRLTTLVPEDIEIGTTAALAALLGTTRAAVLTAVADFPGRSTRELAQTVKVAPASASQHATVLREAGLIRTVRYRNTALHSLTNLGSALLDTTPLQDP